MLCQNCEKNEANVKYTQIVNGVKKEMILCEECAEKMGINSVKFNMPISFSNFLGDFFDDYNEEQLLPSFMKEKHNKCTTCGEMYTEFIKTGLLGCPECYDIFEDRLDPVLKNIQGNIKHTGRKPLNFESKLKNIGENKQSHNDKNTSKEPKQQNSELSKLQEELNKAIKEERYEDAAIIRDKIKNIEQK